MNFEGIYNKANDILTKLSLSTKISTYTIQDNWDFQSDSFYLPRSLEAYLNSKAEFIIQNFLHEIFGHGLFIENHPKGKELYSLEQVLHKEEKQYFQNKVFSLDELQIFRENNKTHSKLTEFYNDNIELYEGFALWMEWYLTKELFDEMDFHNKQRRYLDRFSEKYLPYIDLSNKFINYSNELTPHALLFNIGFPKYYNGEIIANILKKFYKEQFNNLSAVILYGSKKPYSDIDLFIIDDETYKYFNGWLDIYAVGNIENFIKNLDISVTDPLFSGSLIYGDQNYINELKDEILSTDITSSAIDYNFSRGLEQYNYYLNLKNERDRKTAFSYSHSYYFNALALQNGNKPLTFNELNFWKHNFNKRP